MTDMQRPDYAPLEAMADVQDLDIESKMRSCKTDGEANPDRKRHWQSWSMRERILVTVSLVMAINLIILSAYILACKGNKLVISTNKDLVHYAKFMQGAWLTFQSFAIMALMFPIWSCVTTIKSEEWVRSACKSKPVQVKHLNIASTTPTSMINTITYGQSRHASPLFRCAILIAVLAFAASSILHGLLFLNVVRVGQAGTIEIASLGADAVYRYGSPTLGEARFADRPFDEASAIRLASLMYLSRPVDSLAGSLAAGLSASAQVRDTENASIPNVILPGPVDAPDGTVYETDVIIYNTSCGFYLPSDSGNAVGAATIRYSWNEPTAAVQIQLEDGTSMVVGATISLPQNVAPASYLTSPNTLSDYSAKGYTAWIIISNSRFNSIKLEGLPAAGNLSAFAREANGTTATVLLCQPKFTRAPVRVQYTLRESKAQVIERKPVGNIDFVQAGLLFSSMMAALHRSPGNSSFVGSDDVFSTGIVLDQARQYTKDEGWIYPNPLPVIEQNLTPYWSTIGKAYLVGQSARNTTTVRATVPIDGLALSTAKTNCYISLVLFLLLLVFLTVVSSRRVLPTFELIPILEAFSDFGHNASRKEGSSDRGEQVLKQKRVVWREHEGRFEETS